MAGTYIYTKASVNELKMSLEVEAEEFSQTLTYVSDNEAGSNNLTVQFAADLTAPEVTTLNALVVAHDGNPPTYYPRLCRCCWENHNIPGIVEPVECPCCSEIDCLAPIADTEFINEEVHEHFLMDIDYLIQEQGGKDLYNDLVLLDYNTIAKPSSTRLKVNNTALMGNTVEIIGKKSHNPTDYTNYIFVFKAKTSHAFTTYIEGFLFGVSDTAMDKYAFITDGDSGAGYINFVTCNGGAEDETADIAVDPTSDHIYAIKIQSGKALLYIDGVLKATHTTEVPYSVSVGLKAYLYWENTGDTLTWMDFDKYNILLGRAFE